MSSSESEAAEAIDGQITIESELVENRSKQDTGTLSSLLANLTGREYLDEDELTISSKSSLEEESSLTEESEENEGISQDESEQNELADDLQRVGDSEGSENDTQNKIRKSILDLKISINSKLPPEIIEEVQEESELSEPEVGNSDSIPKGNPKLFHILLKKIFEDELERMQLERSAQRMYKLKIQGAKAARLLDNHENSILSQKSSTFRNSELGQFSPRSPGNLAPPARTDIESPPTPASPQGEFPESPKDGSAREDQSSENSFNHVSFSVSIPVAKFNAESPISKSPKAASLNAPVSSEIKAEVARSSLALLTSVGQVSTGDEMSNLQEEKKKLIEQLSEQNIRNHELQQELEFMKSTLDDEHQERMRKEVNTYLSELEAILREK
jgi:hypothetical protein